jgi:ribosomal protein S6
MTTGEDRPKCATTKPSTSSTHSCPEESINEKLDRYHGLLTQAGAEITALDHWGRRQLAYPIRKQAERATTS